LQANWTVMDGSNSVILGNMQKGDYTNVDFNLEPQSTGQDLPIRFEISYTSNDGLRQVEEKIMPLYASSSPPLDSTLSEENSGSSLGSSLLSYMFWILIFVGAAGLFVYKKHQEKTKKRGAEGKETIEKQMEEKEKGK